MLVRNAPPKLFLGAHFNKGTFYESEHIACAIVRITSVGSGEYSPIRIATSSPARPKRKLAQQPAS